MRPALLVQGGAGRVPEDGGKAAREGLEAAASAAWRLLDASGPALEEDPRFNAGYGSVLTEDGDVEMDTAGHLAAATSTGGIAGKRAGRVGDSPLIGCGTYADARGAALARMQALTGGTGGLILLDATGRAGLAHTTPFMAVARGGGMA